MKVPKLSVPDTLKHVTVRAEGDTDETFNRWTNRDVLPVPSYQRNYTTLAFAGWWVAGGTNATAWSTGSSNIANGLSAGEACGAILVGGFLSGLVAFLCGEPGVLYHLGFPMMSRSTFGMYGSYFVIMMKTFVNIIFCGIQCYWGGLAARIVLSCIFPSFAFMANTLPASAAINTPQLIGFVIYIIIFTALLFIHPSKLQPLLLVSFVGISCTFIGLFAYCIGANGGSPSLIASSKVIGSTERAFRFLQAISGVAGGWTGSAIRQSDWTRFAKTKRAPVVNQILGAPISITVASVFGVFATSAAKNMYGVTLWNPIELMQYILTNNYTPAARAGCFFGGLGFFLSQISVNLVQNSVAVGMDLSSMAPRYIDVTRGSLAMVIIGTVINPWRFVNSPGTFITVLSSFGMFIAPLAGINAADFWIVRRLKWRVPDLYIGNKSSIYWYTCGLNWRAFLAWVLVVWVSFPGFLWAVGGAPNVALAWQRIFQVTWFVGFLGGSLIYSTICFFNSPPGGKMSLERHAPFPYETDFIEGGEHVTLGQNFDATESGSVDMSAAKEKLARESVREN
ncbi:hypothetical protein BP5796_06486 [Coleophoma crateriformis]|uniref:Uncharacterized protein n=1 Tax=Coleophoma crateriformis TaxID=565419 RepID=A0A3D8RNT3_9HELO|nr:hypothetical protein BP5796_06486 [Coleophoma crateriformis]